jgi:GT2 family glycosyltransferase
MEAWTAPLARRLRLWLRGWPRLRLALLRLFGARIERARRGRERRRGARYDAWARAHATERGAPGAEGAAAPRVSIVLAAGDAPDAGLRAAVGAVAAQSWTGWELWLAAPQAPAWLGKDPRLHHIASAPGWAEAVRAALPRLTGEFTLPLDAAGALAPGALSALLAAARDHPDAALVYADEDVRDATGRRAHPWFKPALDPEALLATDAVGAPALWRTALLARLGGPDPALGEGARHDLLLRTLEAAGAGAVIHVPRVLFHATAAPPARGSVAAVTAHLARQGPRGAVAEHSPRAPSLVRVRWPLPERLPLVSILIPTRDRAELLGPCVAGLLGATDYPALEVLVVDNGSARAETFALFESWKGDARVQVLPAPGPFNYARLNNQAAAAARGEVLLLLNNDTEVTEPGWLAEMVSLAVRPEVGAVGARLLYPDGTLQHAGVVLGFGWPRGVAGHVYLAEPGDHLGERAMLGAVRGVSAVTAACLAVRRESYLAVGGMDEAELAVAFNDVDFCLKLGARGLRNLWTPFATLLHKESASRGRDLDMAKAARLEREVAVMRARWGALLDEDPHWNPNLSLLSGGRDLAAEPRARKPRRGLP